MREGGLAGATHQISGTQTAANNPTLLWMNALWKAFEYNKTLGGHKGRINLSFDWEGGPSRAS